jgi:hypothetical protein
MGWIELCKSIAFVEEARRQRQRIAKLIAAGEIVFILAGLRLSYSGTDQSLGVMPTIYKYASERSQQRMYTGAGGR